MHRSFRIRQRSKYQKGNLMVQFVDWILNKPIEVALTKATKSLWNQQLIENPNLRRNLPPCTQAITLPEPCMDPKTPRMHSVLQLLTAHHKQFPHQIHRHFTRSVSESKRSHVDCKTPISPLGYLLNVSPVVDLSQFKTRANQIQVAKGQLFTQS